MNNIADDIHNAYEEGYADGKRDAVVHGHWEFLNDYQSRCTACDKVFWIDHENEMPYCPQCGAKMDEKVNII